MTSSVDGLISGLNTSQLIAQLMQAEAQPQTDLKTKVGTEQKVIGAYQVVNGRMAAVATAATALTTAGGWQPVKASSSSATVAATAVTGATTGNVTFDVKKLASAQVTTLAPDPTGAYTTGGGLDISIGGAAPVHVDVGTDTAAGAAAAINAKSLGIRASVIVTDSGPLLQLTAASTGTAAGFTVDGSAAGANVVSAGADAQIAVGDPAAGGYTMSSPTNSFTGVLPGVAITVMQVQAGATVSVTRDSGQIADKIQSLVDATNAALTEIGNQTAYDPSTKTARPLGGNFAVQRLQQNLLSAISNGDSGYGSFAQLGVGLDKSGQLTFDRSAFLAAYQADPDKVQAAVYQSVPSSADPTKTVLTGLAGALSTIATAATNSTNGSLTLAIQSRDDSVRSLNTQIDDWDVRLATRQTDLQRQYANLEVSLGKLKDQASWLSGQIASLPTAG